VCNRPPISTRKRKRFDSASDCGTDVSAAEHIWICESNNEIDDQESDIALNRQWRSESLLMVNTRFGMF
jgi:hypothetical protein